jgi:nucleoside-diphosphate-sugar epimerase
VPAEVGRYRELKTPMPKVLVTGASGFIAKHCIAELLRRGFPVRGTLRSLDRADEVRASVARAGAAPEGLELVSADLTRDDGWDAAVAGCEFVQHVASPFPIREPKRREDVIGPAREGALRVLAAATRGGIKRVVLTSSIVSITLPWPEAPLGHVFTEKDWTNPGRPDITTYVASKALAELAAWDFVRTTKGAPELAAVNPAFVLGPAPDADLSTSQEVIRLMGQGAYPAAPRVGFPISDVRDVAVTHALAMTSPKAAGERFLSANGFLRLYEIGQIVAATLPDLKRKVPKFEMHDFAVRLLSYFDRRLKAVLPDLGHPRPVSNAKAQGLLEQTFRSPQEAVKAAALSQRALHII